MKSPLQSLSDVQQLGIQLQKFGANLKAMADQATNTIRHVAYLFAAVEVLKSKGLITKEEIEEVIRSKKETL